MTWYVYALFGAQVRYLGSLLAHNARDARRRARVIWPEGRLLLRSRLLEEET
jgi:uncharacterized membrane protein